MAALGFRVPSPIFLLANRSLAGHIQVSAARAAESWLLERFHRETEKHLSTHLHYLSNDLSYLYCHVLASAVFLPTEIPYMG